MSDEEWLATLPIQALKGKATQHRERGFVLYKWSKRATHAPGSHYKSTRARPLPIVAHIRAWARHPETQYLPILYSRTLIHVQMSNEEVARWG